jgi:hypothetical protein
VGWQSAYGLLIAADPTMEDAYWDREALVAQTDHDGALQYLKRGIAAIALDAAKIRLYQQIVDTDQADVGAGKPLSSAGLDALIEIAKLDLGRGDKTDAQKRLGQVQTADKNYRARSRTCSSRPAPTCAAVIGDDLDRLVELIASCAILCELPAGSSTDHARLRRVRRRRHMRSSRRSMRDRRTLASELGDSLQILLQPNG